MAELSMRLPLTYLRGVGVVPVARPPLAERPVEQLLEDYCVHLARERGLAPETIRKSERVARLFLEDRERIDGLALERLTAADVSIALDLARSFMDDLVGPPRGLLGVARARRASAG